VWGCWGGVSWEVGGGEAWGVGVGVLVAGGGVLCYILGVFVLGWRRGCGCGGGGVCTGWGVIWVWLFGYWGGAWCLVVSLACEFLWPCCV